MATVERLYELYNILKNAKDAAPKHQTEYEEILRGFSFGPAEMRLASQFSAQFCQHFPNLSDETLNHVISMCENEDPTVQKQAIRDLVVICKNKKTLVGEIANVVAQIMQQLEGADLPLVQSSLANLVKLEPKGAVAGIFRSLEDEMVTDGAHRVLEFIQAKIVALGPEVFTAEVEQLIFDSCKKAVLGVSPHFAEREFMLMMGIFKELKCCQTVQGYQQMVDLVEAQLALDKPLNRNDALQVNRLASCMKLAVPFFSSQIRSTKFVQYLCKQVVPHLSALNTGEADKSAVTLELLKCLAEVMAFAGALEDVNQKVEDIYAQLLDVLPVPPVVSDSKTTEMPSVEFTRLECLLFTFHHLARQYPEFLTENEERLKTFRVRLQYSAQIAQAYQKTLTEALAGKRGEVLKSEENRIRQTALKCTGNISSIIKGFFHNPPIYKTRVILSWKDPKKAVASPTKLATAAANGSNGTMAPKRHVPITFGTESTATKSAKESREIYAPPKDKFSGMAGGGARGHGRGGRGFAGRGRGFSFRGNYGSY